MLVARQQYSRGLRLRACEIDSGKSIAEVARRYQLNPKRPEVWKSEWRAQSELSFPGKGNRREPKGEADSGEYR